MSLTGIEERAIYCECARATCTNDVLESQDAIRGPFSQVYCSVLCGEIDGYEPDELEEVVTPWVSDWW